jgi:hypothetical protein
MELFWHQVRARVMRLGYRWSFVLIFHLWKPRDWKVAALPPDARNGFGLPERMNKNQEAMPPMMTRYSLDS